MSDHVRAATRRTVRRDGARLRHVIRYIVAEVAAAGMSAAPKITALRGEGVSLAVAADAFLATPRTVNPDPHRAYASAIDRVAAAAG
ncbi:hypothetical protein ACIA8R_33195 [Nonomuraea sp. NPDC051191]|uniref:hypothetical protein n=1 Tax=Nonomuraea sp. NPDC051191 TaxID=3364372 RepID=UPI003795666B